jgi:hypothetical protein
LRALRSLKIDQQKPYQMSVCDGCPLCFQIQLEKLINLIFYGNHANNDTIKKYNQRGLG